MEAHICIYKDVLESQNQLRLSNTGCDVIFEIGAKSFPAHRVVLMARVEHFRNMFTADMREKKELTVQFDPLIIDPDFFGEVLNYIYTLKIDFTNENIRAVYKAADYFCFDELTTKVKEHMKKSLYVENVIFYQSISVEFQLESLEADCEKFLIDSSSAVSMKSQLIPKFSLENLRDFTDALKENSKFEDMFEYSIDWVLHDEVNRSEMLSELLENIPEKSLSSQFIRQKVSSHKSLFAHSDYLKLVLNDIQDDSRIETLYAIGGSDEGSLSSVSRYNSVTGRWTVTTPMLSKRSSFGCAVIGHKIYACGGLNFNSDRSVYHGLNSLAVFDTDTQTWTQLTPMKHTRQNCAMATLNGQIYAAGGWYDRECLAVVERYDVQTNRWHDIAPMNFERTEFELVALNGYLYAIGGIDNDDHSLNSVERYDPQTDQWTPMSHTNNACYSFCSAVLNGYIYIVGLETCEMYSPEEDWWTELPKPNKRQFGGRLAAYDNRLYYVGGEWDKQDEGSKTVEVFDVQARVWRPETDMDVPRCYFGVAVVMNQ